MVNQLNDLKEKLSISNKSLADDLGISTSLLSLVLRKKRPVSSRVLGKINDWVKIHRGGGESKHPNSVFRSFLAEREAFLAPSTAVYYREKLTPFVDWCEKRGLNNVLMIDRSYVAEFIGHIRKGRNPRNRKPLNNGAIKLHHQTLKTYFNYVSDVFATPPGWVNPTLALKVKPSDVSRVEFSDIDLARITELMNLTIDIELRSRNLAMSKVLLHSRIRASELLSMKLDDISLDGRFEIVGKGGKSRTVTAGTSGLSATRDYLDVRSFGSQALWLSHFGRGVFYWLSLVKFDKWHIRTSRTSTVVPDAAAHRWLTLMSSAYDVAVRCGDRDR